MEAQRKRGRERESAKEESERERERNRDRDRDRERRTWLEEMQEDFKAGEEVTSDLDWCEADNQPPAVNQSDGICPFSCNQQSKARACFQRGWLQLLLCSH